MREDFILLLGKVFDEASRMRLEIAALPIDSTDATRLTAALSEVEARATAYFDRILSTKNAIAH